MRAWGCDFGFFISLFISFFLDLLFFSLFACFLFFSFPFLMMLVFPISACEPVLFLFPFMIFSSLLYVHGACSTFIVGGVCISLFPSSDIGQARKSHSMGVLIMDDSL
jgi:hypothetical protein